MSIKTLRQEKRKRGVLIIPIGVSGSGKTSHFSQLQGYIRISPDEIRKRFKEYSKANNGAVFMIALSSLNKALARGENVFFDATNLTKAARNQLKKIAKKNHAKVKGIYFKISADTALKRLKDRTEQPISEDVLKKQFKTLQDPTNELWHELIVIEQN